MIGKKSPKNKKTKVNKRVPLPIPFSDIKIKSFEDKFEYDVDPLEFDRIKSKTKRNKNEDTKIYWTSSVEDAIAKYIATENTNEKNSIYESSIKAPMEKLVENVINTFKFEYFETDKETAKKECIGHIMSKIYQFDPVGYKGKSFGYFSVTAKNFFILVNNSNHKRWKKHEMLEYYPENERGESVERHIPVEDHVKNKMTDKSEFVNLMIEFWEKNLSSIFTKEIDIKIANSILDIFKFKEIDVYNKKYIYFCIKEMCNCKTQQLTKVINKMKKYQSIIHSEYINTGKINNRAQKTPSSFEEENIEDIMSECKSI